MPSPASEAQSELTPEETRVGAQLELEYALQFRARAFEEAAAMSRWLVASMLAVNLAGAGAVLGLAPEKPWAAAACAAFVAGILLAFVAGSRAAKHSLQAFHHLGPAAGYWLMVSRDGERIPAIEDGH